MKHFEPAAALGTAMELFWRQGLEATGIQDVVAATGVNRSSLYATFGGKKELYMAALRRYMDEHATPAFAALAADDRGLPAIAEFYDQLVQQRCEGRYARFGCMIVNANAGPESADPDVRQVLDHNQESLVAAMRSALERAAELGQLRAGLDPGIVARTLAVTAYGLNLRSRAGAAPDELRAIATVLLESFTDPRHATPPPEAAPPRRNPTLEGRTSQ
ncbi:TetR/AcrR family transcriptional regulator [Allostreptomyces psammosilenae]|uniref:AcrR family transcriptional regulator n=1 Tax=Allostreptomyces psammosilenae TaxID=1892865 RepID=A0A852ZZR9_9ACTN|nr:TetR/AcrR family transcriptional regulator [Allostreptomyces psammosilenae]NYI06184.1 AcrR family transcriptional regulator [Allostreptomyces psammosilenae]